jgi:hypothetical protein
LGLVIDDEIRGPGAPPILKDDDLLKSIKEFKDHNGQVMKAGGKITKILFVSKRRKLDNAVFYVVGQHVHISCHTVSSCDGDMSQIKCITGTGTNMIGTCILSPI